MIEVIASIITTLALIYLSSHDFHKTSKKPTKKQEIKRIHVQNRDTHGRYLPLQISYVWPRFRHVEERLMVRV